MSRQISDIVGKRFERLQVIDRLSRSCLCLCDCGTEKWISKSSLTSGATKSCGCLRKEVQKLRAETSPPGLKHGATGTPEYKAWASMQSRCNPNTKNKAAQKYYVDRGVTVCERWEKFENFLEDMGPRPEGTSIDRIDNDGQYEPGNCRWATAEVQNRNTRRNHWVTYLGQTKVLAEWLELSGMSKSKFLTTVKNNPRSPAMPATSTKVRMKSGLLEALKSLPRKSSESVRQAISGLSDIHKVVSTGAGDWGGESTVTSYRIANADLARIDEAAKKLGTTRQAAINLAIGAYVKQQLDFLLP